MTDAPTRGRAPLSRRALLGGLVAGALGSVAGCANGDRSAHQPPATVDGLLAQSPFYIAHRGGGSNWPEMTAYAYEQCSRLPGLSALEVSVCLSSDGVLVCSHDPTTARTTGVDLTIAKTEWSTLSTLLVGATGTTDPGQPARPLSRFDEIVDAYADRFVLFVEPKVPAAVGPLMTRLAALGQPERVVWKQYVNSPHFRSAKEHGFSTWGYVLDEPRHLGANLHRLAGSPYLDMLGAPRTKPAAFARTVVTAAADFGKPTIMWSLYTAEDRQRALRLGCQGLMVSNVTGLLPPPGTGGRG